MVYISLGSNLGDKERNIINALKKINRLCTKVRSSSLYLTEAQEEAGQPDFINQVIECRTELPPEKLLEELLLIEQKAGRVRDPERRYGPRVIDLDILLYKNFIIMEKELTVPHPKMIKRAFVLVPLLELNPDIVNPETGEKFSVYLSDIEGQGIRKL